MRFQLALNVDDLDQAVAYYSKLLGAPVHKRKPGYANFAVDEPPIKLVLFENPGASERLNHVGFESSDDAEVERAAQRLSAAGIATEEIRDEHCCHARKSTVWAQDPQGLMWEFYKVQRDEASFGPDAPEPDSRPAPPADAAGGVCCGG